MDSKTRAYESVKYHFYETVDEFDIEVGLMNGSYDEMRRGVQTLFGGKER